MNSIIPFSSTPTSMSSREIADLTNARHDSVKRTTERLADRRVIGLPPMVEYLDSLGRPAKEYIFSGENGKRDSIIVVAQLSPEFTGRLVDRWQELEAQVAQQQPPIGSSATDLAIAKSLESVALLAGATRDELKALADITFENTDKVEALTEVVSRQSMEITQLRIMTKSRRQPPVFNGRQIGLPLDPPAKPRGEPKGGTHASPREHIRREHYRTLPNGTLTVVKAHWVKKNKKGETLQ